MERLDIYRYYDVESYKVKGRDETYWILSPKKDAAGSNILEKEIKDRLLRLKVNIEKCGGYRKVRERGGTSADRFLIITRNLVSFYLLERLTKYVMTDKADLTDAIQLIKDMNPGHIDRVVAMASFSSIETYADSLRSEYIDRYCEKRNGIPLRSAA